MKYYPALIAIALLLPPNFSLADVKAIIAEGTYSMGDGETPSVAESRALLQAKRTALEQAGTYVESFSKVKNYQLTVDEIQVIASGLMEVEILDKKRTVVGDGINFWVKINAKINSDNTEVMAKKVKEKSVVEEYKRIQAAYDESQKEIEKLKKDLAQAKDKNVRAKVEAKIQVDENRFRATEWLVIGNKIDNSKLDDKIEAYTSAIALNQDFVEAYIERGTQFALRGQYDKAITDYTKAISLEPKYYRGYFMRGWAYYSKRDYDKAIEDYNTIIAIEPNNIGSYFFRGNAYADNGEYEKALADYDNLIRTYKVQYDIENARKEPNEIVVAGIAGSLASAYVGRGNVYRKKLMFDLAIEEFNKAISIVPTHDKAYEGLGMVYFKKQQYAMALENLNRSIALYSENATAHLFRAFVYEQKGQNDKAVHDYSKAIIIDPNNKQAYFFRGVNYFTNSNSEHDNRAIDKALEDLKKSCDLGYKEACKVFEDTVKLMR